MAKAADYAYETNNGTITIAGYTGPGGDVTIPSEIDGLPVTSIKLLANENLYRLTRMPIPHSVTHRDHGGSAQYHL